MQVQPLSMLSPVLFLGHGMSEREMQATMGSTASTFINTEKSPGRAMLEAMD